MSSPGDEIPRAARVTCLLRCLHRFPVLAPLETKARPPPPTATATAIAIDNNYSFGEMHTRGGSRLVDDICETSVPVVAALRLYSYTNLAKDRERNTMHCHRQPSIRFK